MLVNLVHGLNALGNGPAIAYLVIGSLIGMFLGVIPGLGGPVVLSIILAFIYHIDVTGTLCLFLGTHAGSYFSASVTSILLNTPAHPEAFAVTFDGFPMAQHGQAGRALGISATSTCIGGFIGCAVLVGMIQIINQLPTLFHPPEFVALVMLALLLVGTLGTDQVSKALISAGIGLMCSAIGASIVTGTFRYTFGAVGLYGGVSLVALALGSFAVPQMIMVFGSGTTIARQDMTGREVTASQAVELHRGFGRQVVGGILETFRHWVLLGVSALIGVITGIIPGIGGFAANFLSYGVAQQVTGKREQFGTGIAEGIIAPEGSSLSKEAGGLVPIIALGIPGSVGGALFLAALTIKGIKVGYGFSTSYPTLPYEMVWIVALSGLIGTAAGVFVAPMLAKVTRVPGPVLVPFIMVLCVVGPFLADVTFFAVMEMLVFAFIGLALRRLRYSLASFAVGLVLGPTLETNIYLTHNIYPGLTFIGRRPMADVLFFIGIGVLALRAVQIRRDGARARASLEEELAGIDDPEARAAVIREQQRKRTPYPLLGMLVTIALLGVSIPWVVYGIRNYNFATAIMPVIAGLLVVVPALYRLPLDVYAYVRYRQARADQRRALERAPLARPDPAFVGVGASASGLGPPPDDESTLDLLETMVRPPVAEDERFTPIADRSWGPSGQYRRELIAFAWLTGLVAACYLFGFVWGVPAFMVAYGLTCTRRFFTTLRSRLLFTGISAIGMWLVTYEMFKVIHLTFTPIVHL